MNTKQLWMNGNLSDDHAIVRVEAVVAGHIAYVGTHPRRELVYGVDVHETFEQARSQTLRYIDSKLHRYREFRDGIVNQLERGDV